MNKYTTKNKAIDTLQAVDSEENRNQKKNELPTAEEMGALKKLLNKIWGVTEILQSEIGYIKRIYSKPIEPKKNGSTREERIARIKHKLLTSRKKNN